MVDGTFTYEGFSKTWGKSSGRHKTTFFVPFRRKELFLPAEEKIKKKERKQSNMI